MENYDILKLENQLCFSIYAASRSITKLYRPYLEELNITYPQYLVMLVLWEKGTVTLRDLGNKLFLDSGTLTPLLKRLEVIGLIKRERSSEDERLLCVTLTDKGIILKEKALKIPSCLIECMGMDVSDLIDLKSKVDMLISKLNESNQYK